MSELHLLSPRGFRAAAVAAGIKISGKPDVGLLVCNRTAAAAAVFTTNKVIAAPLVVGRENIRGGKLRAIVVNSGNANACTGAPGLRDAKKMCALAGAEIGCDAGEILPSSTGIIGHPLPMEKIESGIRGAAAALGDSREHALAFSDAILTTDLKRKEAALAFKIGRETVRLAGACKGSGMIGPRMALHATMLAYLTTDALIAPPLLRKLLAAAVDGSFNAVTVDDHMSTNDTAAILASGLSGVRIAGPAAIRAFTKALDEVCQSLAYQIAADGEGATKVVKIRVRSAASVQAARAIARAIANSPLVKCAMHGNDPNWGRIVSAAGLAGVPYDPDRSTLTLQKTVVFRHGRPAAFDAEKLSAALRVAEVDVELTCRLGKAEATVWTCDLSKEYVTINADYHT
jgi:glutamate N-acetyltransferase/amino-acid N-acetyltransferase